MTFEGRDLVCLRGGRIVLTDLCFRVEAGGALLVTGPNGSGKSSLLRLMAGLIRPLAGSLLWRGEPVARDRERFRAECRYLGHQDAVKPALTVAENLTFSARLAGGGGDRIDEALSRFGLDALADLSARLLSAGQRRRVALARLVAAPAPLWLLDEPTVALDGDSIRAVEEVVAMHRREGGIAVVSTNAPVDVPGAEPLVLTPGMAAVGCGALGA